VRQDRPDVAAESDRRLRGVRSFNARRWIADDRHNEAAQQEYPDAPL
jgi:hypothetical protein